MARIAITTWLLLLFPCTAFADGVFWGCRYNQIQTLTSRDVVCEQRVEECNRFSLTCKQKQPFLASMKDIFFENIVGDKPHVAPILFSVDDFADVIITSDDGQYIVGLSNRGMTKAFWIRDRAGRIVAQRTHYSGPDHWEGVSYCMQTVTNVSEWFDIKDPDVHFDVTEGKLVRLTVKGCHGKQVEVYKK